MKRKIFSKLLAGALLVASVSSFVSCKDYDDDINNLQKQIDNAALKSDLSALQTTLTSVQSTANSAATTAQQALTNAGANATDIASLKSTAASLGTQVADAAKAAAAASDAAKAATDAAAAATTASQDAIAAAAVAAAAAGEEAVKEAEEKVNAAVADFTAKFDAVNAAAQAAATKEELEAVKKNAEALAKAAMDEAAAKATKADIDDAIAALNLVTMDDVNKAIADAIAAAGAAQGTSQAMGWEKAVTSVELFPTTQTMAPGQNLELLLLTGVEVDNDFGGLTGSKANKFQIAYQDGNALQGKIAEAIAYRANKEIEFDNRVVIRVNPANAEIKKEDIILINSQGDMTLNNLVEVVSVEDYDQLITRAGVATGLKVVNIVRKANVTDAALAAATEGDAIKDTERPASKPGAAMFAIGIKNGGEDRIAYSAFDLGVTYGDYVPRQALDFYVTGDLEGQTRALVSTIKNRWTGAKLIGEDLTAETPDGVKWFAEYTWNAATDPAIRAAVPAVDTVTVAAGKSNYVTNQNARQGLTKYVITDQSTRSFTIEMNPWTLGTGYMLPGNAFIQYYYVTLDKFAAVESSPSEYEAWRKYDYTGLYTITPATDKLKVTVNTESAVGDIIGFRLFAVNYDGTLVDPDGQAFYVQVGEPAAAIATTVNVKVTANVATPGTLGATYATIKADLDNVTQAYNSGIAPFTLPENFVKGASFTATPAAGTAFTATTAMSGNTQKVDGTVNGHYYLLKDENGTAATSWNDLKFIAIDIDEIENIVDGTTITTDIAFSGTDADHHNATVNTVKVTVTKDMPTGPKNFSWKSGAPINGNVLTLYMTPSTTIGGAADWTANATVGWVKLDDFCNNINANYRFRLADANVLNDGAYERTVDGAAATVITGKSVYVQNTATGEANDAAGFRLGLQGPAALTSQNTYVNGTKTSAIQVQYTYATAISKSYKNGAFQTATRPTVNIPSTVNTVKFTYAMRDNTYRPAKYEYVSRWNAGPSGTPKAYVAGAWTASNEYAVMYDGTADFSGTAVGEAFTFAKKFAAQPIDHDAYVAGTYEPDVYRWEANDAAILTATNLNTLNNIRVIDGGSKEIVLAASKTIWAAGANATQISLPRFLICENSEYAEFNNVAFNAAWLLSPAVKFVSDQTQVEEYYNATYAAGGLIQLTGTLAAKPIRNIASTLKITGKDAFGQNVAINIPFTVIPE